MKIKIFILVFCMIFLVGTVSAFEFDNIKSYDSETKTATIKNAFGLGDIIAEVQLNTPLNNKVPRGYHKVAEFEIKGFQDYTNALKELELFDKRKENKKFLRDYDYKYKTYEDILINDYATINNQTVLVGNHTEQKEAWIKLTPANLKKNDVLIIGIFTNVKEGDYVEWIPNIMGVRIDEWAAWTEELNVNIVSYYTLNGTAGVVLDSLGTNDGTNNGATRGVSGLINNSFDFDGINDRVDTFKLASGEFSISLWLDSDSFTNDANPLIFNAKELGQNRGFRAFILDDGTITINVFDGSTSSQVITSTGLGLSAGFQNFVITSNSTGFLTVYINNSNVGTDNTGSGYVQPTDGTVLTLGNNVGGTEAFDGKIDEVGIWNRTLSSSEVTQLYNEGNGITYTTVFSPIITLNSPIDNFNTTNATVITNGSLVSGTTLLNVSLIVNETYIETNSSGKNNADYLFTYIFSEGNHNWTYESCNTDSCINATTRNISIDFTQPFINLTFPTGTIDFHEIDTNLSLNWTVDDSNLDSCWYNYNGTNVTATCLDNQTNINITDRTNTNLTFYANDTFGNENSSFTSWDYKIFQNSQTFNSDVTEGSLETFNLNVTIKNSLTFLAANLNYNSVAYVGTFETDNNIVIITRDLVIPSVNTQTNYTFNWSILLSDSSIINTTNTNQTVNNLDLDNCSSFTNNLYNYTIVDEENQTQLNNVSADLNIDLLSVDRSTKILNFSKSYTTNPIRVCINVGLETNTYAIDSVVKYEAINYEIEYYNIFNYSLTNSTTYQNITLYDLFSVDSTEFQLTFTGSDFLPVENALIFVDRQYIAENNTFKTVELPKTDSNGQTVLHLVRNNILYNLKVILNGSIIGSFQNIIAFCEDVSIGDCKINLNAVESTTQAFNYQQDLGLIFTSPIFNESSSIMSFDFTTTDGTAKTILMNITRNDIFGNRTVCFSTLRTSSGTLSCNVGSIDDTYLRTIISVDGQDVLNDQIRIDSSNYGNIGYLVLLFMSISLIFLFSESKLGVLIGVILGYVTGIGLGIISSSLFGLGSAGIWLVIITLIGIWKLNQEWQQ